MKSNEIIREMLYQKRMTQTWLCKALGYKNANTMSQMMRKDNLSVSTLCKCCEALGYEITVQPKRESGVRPQGQLVLEAGEPQLDWYKEKAMKMKEESSDGKEKGGE